MPLEWNPPGTRTRLSARSKVPTWCRERDSNPQGLLRRILSPLRLPVPPSRRIYVTEDIIASHTTRQARIATALCATEAWLTAGKRVGQGVVGLGMGVIRLEATVGFEPTHRGFADPRLNHLATSPVN